MFERFTDRARRAVVLAQEEARTLRHSHIGTEHLLLGLLAEGEGIGARALEALGADVETIRNRVLDQAGPSGDVPDDQIPFTPRAKKTMEHSVQEALRLGHNYIGTEHLLLGLLRETEGVAFQVLTAVGIDLDAARLEVVELLSGIGVTSGPPQRPSTPSGGRVQWTPALEAALAQAASLAGDDRVGTHHVLAALTTIDDAVAPQILVAGGFDAAVLPVEIAAWDVTGTGDEDPVDRAARGTVVVQDASGMTVRLEDDVLRERIARAISAGRIKEEQLREALGRVWADFAIRSDDVAEQDGEGSSTDEPGDA